MGVMKHLAEEIGVRVGGSEGSREAAEYLRDEFENLGLDASLQPFSFEGYEVTTEWNLDVHSHAREIDVAPVLYSGSTPEDGVRGTIHRAGTAYLVDELFELPRYAIVGDDGETKAHLFGNVDGEAFPIPYVESQFVGTFGIVSSDDHQWLDEQDDGEVEVTFTAGGERDPDCHDQNVVTTIEGEEKPDEEVVIGAHYDSAYGAPGASDNASGVEALISVAEHFLENPPERSITFVCYGCEEWWLLGSRYYVQERKAEGSLDSIVAKVNIDMAGGGDTLNVWAGDGDIKTIAGDAVQQVIPDDQDRHYQHVISGSDHWPYYKEGIPVAMIIYWPYDYYHLSSDTVDRVDPGDIEDTIDIAVNIVENLDRSPEFSGTH